MPIHRRPRRGNEPRRARTGGPGRSVRLLLAVATSAIGTSAIGTSAIGTVSIAAVSIAATPVPAMATTRDVEVVPAAGAPPGLAITPAVAVEHGAGEAVRWPVRLVNGGPAEVALGLRVHLAVPDEDGAPSPGPVADWAVLPRSTVDLAPGEAAEFTALLQPSPSDLPAAVVLVASTPGPGERRVRAMHVLLPQGHDPQVTLDLEDDTATVASSDLAVVDLAVASAAPPRRQRTTTVGPLVVFPGASRTVAFEPASSPLGSTTTAVVGIDGVEVARATVDRPNWPARALAVLAAGLVLAAGALAVTRLRAHA